MQCPKCGSDRLRILETRPGQGNILRRRRNCRRCNHDFATTERISVFSDGEWQDCPDEITLPPTPTLPPPPAETRRARPREATPDKFWPITAELVANETIRLPADVVDLLLLWWNTARRSRHGTRATWTRTAWELSCRRVVDLWLAGRGETAQRLAQAGAEHGWQALKPEYLDGSRTAPAPQPAGLTPRDPAMSRAAESWDSIA